MSKWVNLGMALLLALATAAPTPALARAPRAIDNNDTVTLSGNVHPQARAEFDRGATDPTLAMDRMILTLQIPAAKQAELDRLQAEQQDPSSANYHRWLTPEQFADRFAPGVEEVGAITGWLASQGFSIDEVSRGRTSVNFSGNVTKVEHAFHTRMRNYEVDGVLRHANSVDPSIPRGLSDLVGGIVSLHNFPRHAMNSGSAPVPQDALQPEYTSGPPVTHYLAPGDFAAIYNLKPLYDAQINGTGQTIAIVARTHPSSSNWTSFRSLMGLSVNPVQVIVNGTDPGDLGAGEDNEADLDVEWSGAVAKLATIKFVVSKTTATTDGVDLSAQYIVNNDLAPVMSTSFGLCEAYMSSGENAFYNTLWQQAAIQGITSFVSSGDSGAAGCSAATASSGSGLAVNGLASTPYNVAVGGTQFSDQGGGYWNASNDSYYTSATGYIPEAAWNESGNNGGTGLWSTGGGASSLYAKPAWQVAPGVPQDGKRDIPDVSLTAAGHDGYLVKSQGNLYVMSGTSASAPAFAGLMALIVQKTGQRQGNANPRFYQLGNAQYGAAGTSVFHDTSSGSNSVPGVSGYSSVTGYDLATGLGSVDASALVNNWAVPVTPLAVSSSSSLTNGTLGAAYSSALAATGGSAPYNWTVSAGSLPAGLALASTGAVSGTPTTAGVFSFTVRVSDSVGATATRPMSQAVSAAACGNWPVQAGSLSTLFYADFLSAYPVIADGETLKLQALDFGSDFVLDRDIRVTLDGGYDCGYTANAGTTGVLGKLKVSNGTVKVGKVRIK